MYTATMLYHFKDDSFEAACEIWKDQVMEHAKGQPGFIRMQFLLMTQLHDHVSGQPQQTIWDLRYFAEKE